MHETVAGFFPSDPPDFYLVPFGFNDRETIRRMLAEAGFGPVTIEDVPLEGKSPSAEEFAIGLVEGNPIAIAINPAQATMQARADRNPNLAQATSARQPLRPMGS